MEHDSTDPEPQWMAESLKIAPLLLALMEEDPHIACPLLLSRLRSQDFFDAEQQERFTQIERLFWKQNAEIEGTGYDDLDADCLDAKMQTLAERFCLLSVAIWTRRVVTNSLSHESDPGRWLENLHGGLLVHSSHQPRVMFLRDAKKEVGHHLLRFLESRYPASGEVSSDISWGALQTFSNVTNGIRPGSLSLIAAAPGHGKSALLVGVALSAIQMDKRFACLSLRDRESTMVTRIMGAHARADAVEMSNGNLWDRDFASLIFSSSKMMEHPFSMICMDGAPLYAICAMAETLVKKDTPALLMIDDLDACRHQNGTTPTLFEFSGALFRLQQLARQTGVPVLVTCSLMDDVRMLCFVNSLTVHQMPADTVVTISSLSEKSAEERFPSYRLEILRNAFGPTPQIEMFFDRKVQQFMES